jgi:hypothetical protein
MCPAKRLSVQRLSGSSSYLSGGGSTLSARRGREHSPSGFEVINVEVYRFHARRHASRVTRRPMTVALG